MSVLTRPASQRGGRVRAARLTDLAALGDLSRRSHQRQAGANGQVRTLGLPVTSSQISVFSLFSLPLGGFQPHDQLYVYEERGRLTGLARIERETPRDEWTIVELDAIDDRQAGDIRYRLVQHMLRDGTKHGAARFHVACADEGSNVELFMQAGFARYGEESVLFRSPEQELPPLPSDEEAAQLGIRPAVPLDAVRLDRLYRSATPAPVSRLEAYRLHDWERQGTHWRIPRSALTPILRFADIEAFVQQTGPEPDPQLLAFVQVGVAKEDQPHYIRLICLAGHDPSPLISYGMGIIALRSGVPRHDRSRRPRIERGIVSAVRTYESPLDRRLEEHGFMSVASVSLLMKETLARVTEPALVPAASR
jgi:hypothetical protein